MQEASYLKTIATNRKVDSYHDFRDEVRPTRRNRDYKLVWLGAESIFLLLVIHGRKVSPDDCDIAATVNSFASIRGSFFDSTRSFARSLQL